MVPGPRQLTVSWKRPDNDGGSGITSYDLRHKKSSDPDQPASWTDVSPVWSRVSGALEYEITALENGTSYDVQVRAVNSIDPGPWSIPESKTPGDALGPPLNVIAKAQERALEISWGAPAGASGVITWEVRYIQSDITDRADENWESEDRLTRPAPYRHTINRSFAGDQLRPPGPRFQRKWGGAVVSGGQRCTLRSPGTTRIGAAGARITGGYASLDQAR